MVSPVAKKHTRYGKMQRLYYLLPNGNKSTVKTKTKQSIPVREKPSEKRPAQRGLPVGESTDSSSENPGAIGKGREQRNDFCKRVLRIPQKIS